MKTLKYLRAIIVLAGILLSACAPAAVSDAPANVGGGKPLSNVIFTGVIESMDEDQWVINGQTVKVDSSILRDGPFQVGDTVKVEASVAEDGSIIAERVETPSADDLVDSNSNSSDDSPLSNDNNDSQSLVFDDSGTEAFGTVDAMTDTSVVVGGQTFTFAEGAEIKGEILPGAFVELEFVTNPDGSLSVIEITLADPSQIGDDNGNDDNSNDNSNDDNGNDDNSNDDDDNDDNSNDDHGNDDDSNDDNEDNSSNSNDNG